MLFETLDLGQSEGRDRFRVTTREYVFSGASRSRVHECPLAFAGEEQRASNISAPSWPDDTAPLKLRRPAPPRHWLRRDVAESPPSRVLPVTGSPANRLLVQPFPAPGQLVALAYRELDRAATGSPEQIRARGDARLLPRPWEPVSCRTPFEDGDNIGHRAVGEPPCRADRTRSLGDA